MFAKATYCISFIKQHPLTVFCKVHWLTHLDNRGKQAVTIVIAIAWHKLRSSAWICANLSLVLEIKKTQIWARLCYYSRTRMHQTALQLTREKCSALLAFVLVFTILLFYFISLIFWMNQRGINMSDFLDIFHHHINKQFDITVLILSLRVANVLQTFLTISLWSSIITLSDQNETNTCLPLLFK